MAFSLPYLGPKTELHLENSIVYVGGQSVLDGPGGQRIILRNNTLCSWTGIGGGFFQAEPDAKAITITAEGNIFDLGPSQDSNNLPLHGLDWRGRVAWLGKNNLYRGLGRHDGKENIAGLAGWAKLTGRPEEGSREAGQYLYYGFEQTFFQDAKDTLPLVRQALEKARQQSGLKDVGPDFDLIGAGDGYVRALAAAGKPVQLRPEPEPDGPCVLLREGKVQRGYPSARTTVESVQNGDIVEIRSDSDFPGFYTPAGRGTLTIRAAPGYRPIVRSDIALSPRYGRHSRRVDFFQGQPYRRGCRRQDAGHNCAAGELYDGIRQRRLQPISNGRRPTGRNGELLRLEPGQSAGLAQSEGGGPCLGRAYKRRAAVITCYLRYIIDPDKVAEFEEYARMWIPLVERFGGRHHDYFLPP